MSADLAALARDRFVALHPVARGALCRAVEAAERAADLLHRHRAGGRAVPHPITLTPFVVARGGVPTLARLADAVHRFQALAPRLYREDADGFRALCPVPDTIARWLGRTRADTARRALMIRPDVGLVGPGAAGAPVLFESNATGLAGLYNHAAGVAILRHEVFPRLLAPREARRLADPPDLLALVFRWALRAARAGGARRPRGVAFVEEAAPFAGYSEMPRLTRAFAERGVRAGQGTTDQLRVRRGTVYLRDLPVDLLYRDLGYDDLGGGPGARGLDAFTTLHDRGAVLPGLAGEFAHKGLLEALTRPAFRGLFSRAERRLLARAVPWTRVLASRFTEGPDGRRVDLVEHVRRHRARFLIKPNVGSSGDGILLGGATPPARWEARLARALREPGAWVVQERRALTPRALVYLRDGRTYVGPCFFSLGLFYAPGDLGLHCRVSRAPIVNVARDGALACAFLGP